MKKYKLSFPTVKALDNVEDWFKAEDQLTKIELVKLIIDKSKTLGYRLSWLSLYREKYVVARTEEFLNRTLSELPKDFDDFETLVLTKANTAGAIDLSVNLRDITVNKVSQKQATTVDFTNEELKFFDSLGFRLGIYHSRYSNQEIEDWFKAEDAVDTAALLEQIRRKLNFEEAEETRMSYKLSSDIPVNGRGTKNLILQRSKSDGKILLFEEYGTPASSIKRRDYKLMTEEMRAEMSKLPLKEKPTPVSKLDLNSNIVKNIISEYKRREENKEIRNLNTEARDVNSLLISYEVDYLPTLFVRINFRSKSASKSRGRDKLDGGDTWKYYIAPFYDWELKLLDSVGLKLTSHYSRKGETNIIQSVEDWFNKAEDAISIEEFLVSEGYTKATEEYLERDLIDANWIIFVKPGPLYPIVFGVNKTEKLINKVGDYEAGSFPAVEFTKAELKYFDAMGYQIEDKDTEQNIEDWFKAEDSVNTPIPEIMKSLGYVPSKELNVKTIDAYEKDDSLIFVYRGDRMVDKWKKTGMRANTGRDRQLFTDEELRTLDDADLNTTEEHSIATKQFITDWFTNKIYKKGV